MNFTKLKDCLDKIINTYNAPSVDCIVYQEHKMLFRYFAGLSDIKTKKVINGNELYFIFSMTKMLTCTAALQLFEQGKYLLDDPISKFLPNFENMKITHTSLSHQNDKKIITGDTFKLHEENTFDGYAKNPIRIIDLFTMSAGFDYSLNDTAISDALKAGKKSTLEIVNAMSEKTLCFEPGTRFKYSLCHDILGALIEIWSGQKLGEYMKTNIFEPLCMNNTFFGLPKDAELLNRMATRYTYDTDRNPEELPLECIFNFTDEYESGGAGLVSCTEDYALFLDALSCNGVSKDGKRILSPQSIDLMKKNHLNQTQLEDFSTLAKPGYGYGLGVRTHLDKEKSGSPSPIGEFGWDGAAGAFSLVDTENKLSLTYFQHIHKWSMKIQHELRNALYESLT